MRGDATELRGVCGSFTTPARRAVDEQDDGVDVRTMKRSLLVSLLALSGCSKSDTTPAAVPSATVSVSAAPSAPPSTAPSASAVVTAPFAASSSEIAYTPYENGRFCCHLDTPRGMRAEVPPENGDGQSWKSADGTAEIKAWGANIVVADQLIDALFADESKDAPGNARKVTLKVKQKGSFVVSGYDGTQIFYEKYVFAADHYVLFVAKYAPSGKGGWDRVVEHMAASFRAC